jgi:virginiamycin B lyase
MPTCVGIVASIACAAAGGTSAITALSVREYPVPAGSRPHDVAPARDGGVWYTAQGSGELGWLDPKTGKTRHVALGSGSAPHGVIVGPDGAPWITDSGPPTRNQGARRAWSDSKGRIWVSEWNAGKVAMYAPSTERWREWRLPGATPMPYAVYVDERDDVWLSDFGANALVRLNPKTERFTRVRLPSSPAKVRQILGRRGEVWGAESGVDKLVVVRTP